MLWIRNYQPKESKRHSRHKLFLWHLAPRAQSSHLNPARLRKRWFNFPFVRVAPRAREYITLAKTQRAPADFNLFRSVIKKEFSSQAFPLIKILPGAKRDLLSRAFAFFHSLGSVYSVTSLVYCNFYGKLAHAA